MNPYTNLVFYGRGGEVPDESIYQLGILCIFSSIDTTIALISASNPPLQTLDGFSPPNHLVTSAFCMFMCLNLIFAVFISVQCFCCEC